MDYEMRRPHRLDEDKMMHGLHGITSWMVGGSLTFVALNSSMANDYMTFTSREGVENHIRDVCELKAYVYLQQFIAWKGELLFDLVTTSVDVILDVFGNVCACGIY